LSLAESKVQVSEERLPEEQMFEPAGHQDPDEGQQAQIDDPPQDQQSTNL